MPGSEKEYKYWGKLAKNFHEDNPYVVGPNIYPEVKEWLVNEFNDEDTVLELGCGTGLNRYGNPCSYGKNLRRMNLLCWSKKRVL